MSVKGFVMVILGPKGCGKTRNAEHIRKYFDAHCVLEGDALQSFVGADGLNHLAENGVRVVVLTADARYANKLGRRAGHHEGGGILDYSRLPAEARKEPVDAINHGEHHP